MTIEVRLSEENRDRVVKALLSEADRLESLIRDYKGVRGNTRNPVVRAMADEGMICRQEKAKELRTLATTLGAGNGES